MILRTAVADRLGRLCRRAKVPASVMYETAWAVGGPDLAGASSAAVGVWQRVRSWVPLVVLAQPWLMAMVFSRLNS